MKSLLSILVSFLLFGFNTTHEEKFFDNSIRGTWKGGFGSNNQIIKATVRFKLNNAIEFYEGELKEKNKALGSYELRGDTALLLTYIKPTGSVFVLMEGNLNRTKNFVDGVWKCSDAKGSFYLQKQNSNIY